MKTYCFSVRHVKAKVMRTSRWAMLWENENRIRFLNINTKFVADSLTEEELRKAICGCSANLHVVEGEEYRRQLVGLLCAEVI
jgi:hypothetical protein